MIRCRVGVIGTDVLEERIVSIFRMGRIGKLGSTPAVTSNCCQRFSTLKMEMTHSTETSFLTTLTLCHIREETAFSLISIVKISN
jgi:hypothetical protein